MDIYVGNLSTQSTEEDLREAFKAFGDVASIKIIKDKFSGISRGFGFVVMRSKTEGKAAIASLNSKELKGLKLMVQEARPSSEGH